MMRLIFWGCLSWRLNRELTLIFCQLVFWGELSWSSIHVSISYWWILFILNSFNLRLSCCTVLLWLCYLYLLLWRSHSLFINLNLISRLYFTFCIFLLYFNRFLTSLIVIVRYYHWCTWLINTLLLGHLLFRFLLLLLIILIIIWGWDSIFIGFSNLHLTDPLIKWFWFTNVSVELIDVFLTCFMQLDISSICNNGIFRCIMYKTRLPNNSILEGKFHVIWFILVALLNFIILDDIVNILNIIFRHFVFPFFVTNFL